MRSARDAGQPTARAVRLVAEREVRTQIVSKAFLISNGLILAVIVGGIVVASILTGRSDEPAEVGLVGDAPALSQTLVASGEALGTEVRVMPVGDESTARSQVSAGRLEVALVGRPGGGYTAIVDKRLPAALRPVLDVAIRQVGADAALRTRGVDPAGVAAEVDRASVTVRPLNPPDPDSDQRTGLAYFSVLLLYAQLLVNGIAVASGVVEEKTSRVVELLLSTIRPLQLLTGKIVGIGLIGLAQLAAYALTALVAGAVTGLITVTGAAVTAFVGTLGWFVLGFAFFAVLYAAAASLVTRQEEVASATAPLTVLVLAMFFVAQGSVQDPDGTLSSAMSWIPPFSAILMPLRIASGVTGPVQVVGTVVLMVVVTLGLAVVAARVYERSVLRTGTRVSWQEALGRNRVVSDERRRS